MSEVHYFQRYSQKENVVTNNTLLLFSRLYAISPIRLETLLRNLFDDIELNIGITFQQQISGKGKSVPDAQISQSSLKIVIETKIKNDDVRLDQLEEHTKNFENEDKKVLLLICPEEPPGEVKSAIEKYIRTSKAPQQGESILFCCTTFEKIINSIDDLVQEYEADLKELLDDYREFCSDEGVLPTAPYTMRAIVAGSSLKENREFSLYYCPAERSYQPHDYIGLYTQKSIVAIGKVSVIVVPIIKDGEIKIVEESRPLTEEERRRIVAAAKMAKQNNEWDLTTDHKFFLVDKFYETNYRKTTKYPLQSVRYFDLREILNVKELRETEKIAQQLRKMQW